MEEEFLESPWAQLVSLQEEEVVPIVGDTFSIGRRTDAVDFVILNNKYVSGCHCVLNRKRNEGKVFLRDTSSNGMLLNGKRIERDIEVELKHNDVVTVVQMKDDPELNVAFRFEVFHSMNDSDATLTASIQELVKGEEEEEETRGDSEEHRELLEQGVVPMKVGMKRKLDADASEKGLPSSKVNPSGHIVWSDALSASSNVTVETGEKASTDPPKPALIKKDSIEETLICQICQEILHDCVSLQPCMHSYCAGCYSEWMTQSSSCPACRKFVERINKNHIVNNLVDAYLRANPNKKRPLEDLEELNAKNKITEDMLYPKNRGASHHSNHRYSDDSSSYSSSSSPAAHSPIFTSYTNNPLPLCLCRQCPGYVPLASLPPPPTPHHPFSCSSSTVHVLCRCCLRPMPVRSESSIVQKCVICDQHFCHMYWGCTKPGCLGCIAPFKDLNFSSTCLNGILGNTYESNILKEYLNSKELSIGRFVQACCAKMESGEYSCSEPRLSSTSTITCHSCALVSLKELAYLYRKDIPNSHLPDDVTRRIDCYWGKECRTQFNKTSHAKKFNHICEKTRNS